ncbi:hypothetical protein [Corynebacterium epidermidicanis]|uniref:Uncharacterized protein n=1 Tax=Corynebacterium epidermidicanis TaxID=1050174 RepID=A0A0G3GTW8_9CORY|nr:hypothetical protein [Corynebacterium epidermidicanis]AKK02282.1 hypothetical protein CEPID_02005 [Corynebacterium epidermidicanis]
MKDPTRIPQLTAEIERLWSALPNHCLGDLIGLIGYEHLGEEELPARLTELRRQFPARVSECEGPCVVRTDSHDIAIHGSTAILREVGPRPGRPSIWELSEVGAAQVSWPLRLIDATGSAHTYGIVRSITPLNPEVPTKLDTADRGFRIFVAELSDGTRLLISKKLFAYVQQRRELDVKEWSWRKLEGLTRGQQLRMITTGGEVEELGTVDRVWVVG